jgi:ribonucleoside-diphosphate reductase beta chain
MSSILSWDDLEDSAENPALVKKAADSIKNLDTSAAEEEFREQEMAIAERKANKDHKVDQISKADDLTIMASAQVSNPAGLGLLNEALMKRIQDSIAEVPNIVGTGGRLKVKDKFLLNCSTDLNQLIPFKYGWAWSAYLTSCDKHWMPTEINWLNDEKIYKGLETSSKKIIMRTVVSYMYGKYIYPTDLLMHLYRHITNPECRQYVLRLAFEECCLNHTMRHWEETFNLGAEVVPGGGLLKTSLKVDEDTFKARNLFLVKYTSPLFDPNMSTKGLDNTREFLKNLVVFFGGVKYLSQITNWFQIVKLAKKSGLEGFAKNAEYVLRDLNRQLDFSVNFISTAISENPGVLTDQYVRDINEAFDQLINYELDFVSTLAVDENDYKELSSILGYLKNRYLTKVLASLVPASPIKDGAWFIEYLDSKALATSTNHDVTITSTAGSGGLDFGD